LKVSAVADINMAPKANKVRNLFFIYFIYGLS
jgi:hypothetical protein